MVYTIKYFERKIPNDNVNIYWERNGYLSIDEALLWVKENDHLIYNWSIEYYDNKNDKITNENNKLIQQIQNLKLELQSKQKYINNIEKELDLKSCL
tara:strand:+ start:139 stop:429 length:291 start_codon:yes stop_codon:yes gene_type:complete